MPAVDGSRLVLGAMTGTSCDGLDLALVRIVGRGLDLRADLLAGCSQGYPDGLRQELLAIAAGAARSAQDWCALRQTLAQLHVKAADQLCAGKNLDLASIHGQTVFHRPPLSWQLIDLPLLAAGLGAPVVGDLRAADLAAGGQGAPITPLADLLLFGAAHESRAVVNLGGFCNITVLPVGRDPAQVRGRDVCACNQILDGLARQRLGQAFDGDGAVASRGRIDAVALAAVRALLAAQSAGRRSLGSGDEMLAHVASALADLPDSDALATACAAIAATIAKELAGSDRVLIAGGGWRNACLKTELRAACTAPVAPTDELGVAGTFREAAEMAVLGALCQDGYPITLAQVTGAAGPAPVAGVWAFPPRPRTTKAANPPRPAPTHVAESPAPGEALPPDRGSVLTEQRHPMTGDLHAVSPAQLLIRLHAIDDEIQPALAAALPALTGFLEAVAPGFRRGGRLIYVGAGTSGRLGVLDASEAPPTFLVPPGRIVGIIAGGDGALRRSSEGKEDDPDGAVQELTALGLGPDDAVLGIAAGGTTPYPRGAVSWAAALARPPVTGLLSCAPCSTPPGCQHLIVVATGPEALTGSTRMKAGTATKLALNRLSTALMVLDGRVYENLMVAVSASNVKLRDRAARIIAALTGLDRPASFTLLDAAAGRVAIAVLMHRRCLDRVAAEALLHQNNDRLHEALSAQ